MAISQRFTVLGYAFSRRRSGDRVVALHHKPTAGTNGTVFFCWLLLLLLFRGRSLSMSRIVLFRCFGFSSRNAFHPFSQQLSTPPGRVDDSFVILLRMRGRSRLPTRRQTTEVIVWKEDSVFATDPVRNKLPFRAPGRVATNSNISDEENAPSNKSPGVLSFFFFVS